ncbi:MAG: phenylalanine--tRNA ligase subunit beta [Clostridia bacterium]|nr:phenylalanine--tRNA ligase subunit beta [Clostridia bacterium]
MKLSLNWIKDYVKLPADLDLNRLSYDLTMSTVEVEGAHDLGKDFDGIIVGLIKDVQPHPNADKLRVCSVDIGGEVKEIVCGGSNLEIGQKVVVACPGSFVRWHGEGDLVEIKNAKLRGVPSFGMICASVEIGLADLFPANEEHEIMDVTSLDCAPGTPVADALGLRDIILEIDNKSMTNRPDLWGHYGIARELAALYDLPLEPIEKYIPEDVDKLDIRIADTERCPRYIGARIEGVSVKEAPYEMRMRLWKVGLRPINALVDITNYVMMAVGQPTHAFDSDNILDYIEVRRANEGEKLNLLNDKDLELTSDDLVIADAKEAVALAGVMGGSKDSVLDTTSKVILEVANFESRGIRRTALRYDNRTEASSRYEKAIDPERCDLALSLSMKLFKELYPEMKVTAFNDCYERKLECAEIDVDLDWLDRRLGMRIPKEVVINKLGALGFKVEYSETAMHVTVPTWRSTGDVSIKADIMEEVARMYGYENFQPTPITTSFEGAINQLEIDIIRKVKEYLAFSCNMREIFTYPWMNEEFVKALIPDTSKILTLATPPSAEERFIKSTLLPNICKAIVKNEHNFDEFAIFEESLVFSDEAYTSNYPNEKLPKQERHIGLAFAGSADDFGTLFATAKGYLAEMPSYTHMEGFTFKRCDKPSWADDTAWYNIYIGDEKIGDMGLLSKKTAMACGIKVLTAVLCELNIDAFKPFRSRTNKFVKLPEFPRNEYDLSMLVDSMVKWEDIKECALTAKKSDGCYLIDVDFIDEYTGKQVPEGKKSVTIRLTLGSDEKTLTSAEVEASANIVIKKLSAEKSEKNPYAVAAEIRTK